MNWPSETCEKCNANSCSLAFNKICPYCDPDNFIKRIKYTFKNFEHIENYIKNYKIKINEEIKNRLILEISFGNINKNTVEKLQLKKLLK